LQYSKQTDYWSLLHKTALTGDLLMGSVVPPELFWKTEEWLRRHGQIRKEKAIRQPPLEIISVMRLNTN